MRYRKFVKGDLPREPVTGVAFSGWRDDFAAEDGRKGVDPEKMARILNGADVGNTESMFEMFSILEEDPHIAGVLGKRRRAVTSRSLTITPADESAGAIKAADLCSALIFGEGSQKGIEGWDQSLYDITDAIGRGFSLLQIVWDRSGPIRPAKLEHWPQRECVIGLITEPYSQTGDQVRVLSRDEPTRGEELERGQWILHRHKARSAHLARASLLRVVSWWWLFKHFSVADWTMFSERYGMPLRVGKFPSGSSDKERLKLWDAINLLGKQAGAIVPDGSSVELIQANHQGIAPYSDLVRVCNAEISKAILGTTLTTEVDTSGGNRALGEVQERAEDDITDHDGKLIARTLRDGLLEPIVRFNLGRNVPVPKVAFLEDEIKDLEAMARTDSALVNDIGLPLDEDYFYDAYDRPRPDPKGTLVKGKPAPVAAPAPGDEDLDDDADDDQADEDLDEQLAAAGVDRRSIKRQQRDYLRALSREDRKPILRLLRAQKKKSTGWAR